MSTHSKFVAQTGRQTDEQTHTHTQVLRKHYLPAITGDKRVKQSPIADFQACHKPNIGHESFSYVCPCSF